MISPAITAIIIAVLAALAFVGGFVVSDWRSGAEMARLRSDNAVKSAANQRCAIDIANVRSSIDGINKSAIDRESAAAIAMENAASIAAKHSKTAITIKAAPVIPAANQCEAIVKEQIEYVEKRRSDS